MKLTISLVVIILIIGYLMFSAFGGKDQSLTSPQNLNKVFSKTTSAPTEVPKPTPQRFQFDSSTDLNMELEKVNPKVEESDF